MYNPVLDEFCRFLGSILITKANKNFLEMNLEYIFQTLNFDPSQNSIFLVETPSKDKL